MLFHGMLPSVPSSLVITRTMDCVESIPTCFAIPILFAPSSNTVLPSIDVTDVAGPGCVTVSCGVCSATCCGAVFSCGILCT